MLAVAEHAVPGLSAMAIDEACTWSRRRTHGSALVASRGASTRRRFFVDAESRYRWCEFANGGNSGAGVCDFEFTRLPRRSLVPG